VGAGDEHDSLRHALDARDLNPAGEGKFRVLIVYRLVQLGQCGVGVVVEGSGVRVRLELREGVDEAVDPVFFHFSIKCETKLFHDKPSWTTARVPQAGQKNLAVSIKTLAEAVTPEHADIWPV
jgi:hypothetical protein